MTTSPAVDLAFVKGHGTENDFILVPDPDDSVRLSPTQIRALCDRRAGLGADGLIRVARAERGGYFMDYYNADASVAEMCGNGARVFVRYLLHLGWQQPGSFEFVTRGGVRSAQAGPSGEVAIGMGPVRLGARSTASTGGVAFWSGVSADVGNPHLVCRVDDALADLDLSRAPTFDSGLFPAGVNVEFVDQRSRAWVTMRVFERGSGETRSCGTGTVAAAAVSLAEANGREGEVEIRVPGGAVLVRLRDAQLGDAGRVTGYGESTLIGPAVLVASGVIDADFLASHR